MKEKIMASNAIPVAKVEQIGSGIVRITLHKNSDPNRAIGDMHEWFEKTFKNGISQVIFDMSNVEFPNGSFIAMLIACTLEARRNGGDIKLINLMNSARNNFAMFTPLTYLSIASDEISLLEDYDGMLPSSIEDFVDFERGKPKSLQVEASIDALNRITRFVEILAKKSGMEAVEISKLKIAVYEACMNIVEHGYHFRLGESIRIEVLREGERFEVKIKDTGEPFNLFDVKPYDVKQAFHEKRKGGFGMYIIQRSVDDIKYESNPNEGNCLTLVKKISPIADKQ